MQVPRPGARGEAWHSGRGSTEHQLARVTVTSWPRDRTPISRRTQGLIRVSPGDRNVWFDAVSSPADGATKVADTRRSVEPQGLNEARPLALGSPKGQVFFHINTLPLGRCCLDGAFNRKVLMAPTNWMTRCARRTSDLGVGRVTRSSRGRRASSADGTQQHLPTPPASHARHRCDTSAA